MDINQEKKYLQRVLDVITELSFETDNAISKEGDGILSDRAQVWDTVYEMDEYEQAGAESNVQLKSENYINLLKTRAVLEKQASNPYWGKINFTPQGEVAEDLYFGVGALNGTDGRIYVIDWRAPIADLYYNFEPGKAEYRAPGGVHSGEINYKYQYKIEKGILKYVIDTSATIMDEVLLRELSKNASPIMKNIAATIQREQNRIIRLSFGDNLLVQGVAGSGKTSIALHRVAYILYNCRDTIKAKDILIISPNRAFSGYISNVLPELGEQNVVQISLEEMAQSELKNVCSFEHRAAYLEQIYDNNIPSERDIESMRIKASPEFVERLKGFVKSMEKRIFKARNFRVKDYECTKELFEKLFYKQFAAYPPFQRMSKLVDYVEMELSRFFRAKINSGLHFKITQLLYGMYTRYSCLELYRLFLRELSEEGIAVKVFDINEVLPYEDVYGLLLLKVLVEGADGNYGKYKHVMIDEMQDYIPSQYELINRLFKCPKTALGDLNQIVDPYMNIGSLQNMRALMGEHNFCTLDTSYRSSQEITEFANRLTSERVNPIQRHEEPPAIIACDSLKDQAEKIMAEITAAYEQKGYGSVAVIARNSSQARELRNAMPNFPVTLLLDSSTPYRGGTVITTAVIVKGFEFDEVIIPDADSVNYSTSAEKRILYVSVTRALHSLYFFHTGTPSAFLEDKQN